MCSISSLCLCTPALWLLNLHSQIEMLQQQLLDPSALQPTQVTGMFGNFDSTLFLLLHTEQVERVAFLWCNAWICSQPLEIILCWRKKSSRRLQMIWKWGIRVVSKVVSSNAHTLTILTVTSHSENNETIRVPVLAIASLHNQLRKLQRERLAGRGTLSSVVAPGEGLLLSVSNAGLLTVSPLLLLQRSESS